LGTLINETGNELPTSCAAPHGLRGVPLEAWRLKLVEKNLVGGKSPGIAFGRIQKTLLEHLEIATGNGFVWVPLPI
jgi:hypothetical protein